MWKRVLLFGFIIGGLYKWEYLPHARLSPALRELGGADPMRRRAEGIHRGSVRHVSFAKVSGADFDIPRLADEGSFTVIDFTSDTCPTCLALEPAYEALVRKRPDVSVVRIDLPGGQSFSTNDPAEFERWKKKMEHEMAEVDATLKRFGVCGTPHVAIVDPERKVFRADRCNRKHAFDFLKHWLSEEKIGW